MRARRPESNRPVVVKHNEIWTWLCQICHCDRLEEGQNSLVTIAAWAAAGLFGWLGRSVMSVILLVLGILVAGAGLTAIGFGIPINEFSLGTTLIIAGATGAHRRPRPDRSCYRRRASSRASPKACGRVTGAPARAVRPRRGAAAAASAAAGRRCSRAAAEPRIAAAPPHPPVPPPARRRWRPPSATSARPNRAAGGTVGGRGVRRRDRAIAIEHPAGRPAGSLRGSRATRCRCRPNGRRSAGQHARPSRRDRARAEEAARRRALQATRPRSSAQGVAARLPVPLQAGGPPGAEARTSTRSGPPSGPPRHSARPRDAEPQVRGAGIGETHRPGRPRRTTPRRACARAAPAPRAAVVAILKSGVVDGMAYTLYADGSIEAKLPHGTVRFGSIAELRAHIETNS